jgi:glutamate racemase
MNHDASREPVAAARVAACRIGVFDSGVGGLSVLRALHARLPGVDLHYLADSANAPYGERDGVHVLQRSMRIAEHLLAQGAQLLVVACNTATAVAAAALRERWPGVPIVGVEPGIKPALVLTRNGRIGVMATETTLRSDKFQRLMASVTPQRSVHLRACNGLAAAIERGDLDDPALLTLVEAHCAPLRDAGVDCVVLGCTHYPFVAHHIQAAMGAQVQLVDTAWAVASQAERLLGAVRGAGGEATAAADVLLETTADSVSLARLSKAWLPFACRVRAAPIGL